MNVAAERSRSVRTAYAQSEGGGYAWSKDTGRERVSAKSSGKAHCGGLRNTALVINNLLLITNRLLVSSAQYGNSTPDSGAAKSDEHT